MFRRPELLVAASVPMLLVAGVLSWHRDVLCTQSGCGTVGASAWTGSPVWAVVLVLALALGGVWVLLPPTRGEIPLAVAALTGMAGVVSAAIVVLSLDALVFNRPEFFGFDLPVTETFPVLAVHPGPGLLVGLLGLLLQAAGGWGSVRHRTAPRRRLARPSTSPWPGTPQPDPARPSWNPATSSSQPPPAGPPWHPAASFGQSPAAGPPWDPSAASGQSPPAGRPPWEPAAAWGTATPSTQPPPGGPPWDPAAPSGQPPAAGQVRPAWEAVAFGQGAPPPRRHRRRD